jgi:hypothetical protein
VDPLLHGRRQPALRDEIPQWAEREKRQDLRGQRPVYYIRRRLGDSPMAITVTCSARIDAPLSKVYSVFTDLPGAPGRVRAIRRLELLTPGPFAVGTRFRETRVMLGREASEVMEVVEVRPGQGYSVAASSCGTEYLARYDLTPEGGGTRVDLTFRAEPRSFFAKLMRPLAGLMLSQCRKLFQQDLDDLRQACEGRPAGGAAVAGA